MTPSIERRHVTIPVGDQTISADLNIPAGSNRIVIFAHGSGSSRHSPRNQYVADILNDGGITTLLVDLLTREEEEFDIRTASLRFDISFLADRLVDVTEWAKTQDTLKFQRLGYFGASTGAAAALVAAARRPENVRAIVSRGGRPDLAGNFLADVLAPTVLIVGENDTPVIELNQWAAQRIRSKCHIEIIPGASHLFEEPGTLQEVARLARLWFAEYL